MVEDAAIHPFRIEVPQVEIDELRRRVRATRWPDRETVSDRSQGVQLAKLRPLVECWGTGYDWCKIEPTVPNSHRALDDIGHIGAQGAPGALADVVLEVPGPK